MDGKINFHHLWVIDSSATKHIASNDSVLTDLKESTDFVHVKIPNGDSIPVQGIRSACLPSNLKFNNVLYILNFQCNLLLVKKITKNHNCFITFFFIFFFTYITYIRGN